MILDDCEKGLIFQIEILLLQKGTKKIKNRDARPYNYLAR